MHILLPPAGVASLDLFVALGSSPAAATTAAGPLSTAAGFDTAWGAAAAGWAARWAAAFTPGNSMYSGSLPSLELDNQQQQQQQQQEEEEQGGTPTAAEKAVARIYYAGCVTLLACERTNYPAISPRVYVTGFGTLQPFMGKYAFHGGSAAFYWDQSLLSSLNSLLDPLWMRNFLVAGDARAIFRCSSLFPSGFSIQSRAAR